MILGHKIKNIRELKNLTQEFVAEKLDISQSAYSKIERETKISDEKLAQIAEILEVSEPRISQIHAAAIKKLRGKMQDYVEI